MYVQHVQLLDIALHVVHTMYTRIQIVKNQMLSNANENSKSKRKRYLHDTDIARQSFQPSSKRYLSVSIML